MAKPNIKIIPPTQLPNVPSLSMTGAAAQVQNPMMLPVNNMNELISGLQAGKNFGFKSIADMQRTNPFKAEVATNETTPPLSYTPSIAPQGGDMKYKIAQALMNFGASKSDTIGGAVRDGAMGYFNAGQNVNNYNAYKPYFDKMNIDTTALNPATGGAGFGEMNPMKLVELQNSMENANFMRDYRMKMLGLKENGLAQKRLGKTVKVGTLMSLNPDFNKEMRSKYDFSNGKNIDLFNSEINPTLANSLVKLPIEKQKVDQRGEYQRGQLELGGKRVAIQGQNAKYKAEHPRQSGANKPENKAGYSEGLSQYVGITDPKQKAYARQRFIKLFSVDPEKKIQQSNGNQRY